MTTDITTTNTTTIDMRGCVTGLDLLSTICRVIDSSPDTLTLEDVIDVLVKHCQTTKCDNLRFINIEDLNWVAQSQINDIYRQAIKLLDDTTVEVVGVPQEADYSNEEAGEI